jgi:diphthamide synthase (EF-2-diphthine--ammonia ligase)
MGKYGVSICGEVTKFEMTVLGVPKLQKTIPRNVELPPHLAEA